eukprot:2536727-Alexandrium_andersonii.AAC.1
MRSRTSSVIQTSGPNWPEPQNPAQEVAVPRPTGPMALSAARSLQKFGAPLSRGGLGRRRASRGASAARICI